MTTSQTPLQVATWNLHGAWNAEDQTKRAQLIHHSDVDLLCAQELTARRFRLLCEALGEAWWGVHSLTVRDDLPPTRSYWGVAVFGRAVRTRPDREGAGVIGDPNDDSNTGLFWRRTLHVPVAVDNDWTLNTASVHVRPGSVVGKSKLKFIDRISDWMGDSQRRPLLVGVDANSPGDEANDTGGYWLNEKEVWGPLAVHSLRDVWNDNPTEPAFTHKLRGGAERRFDHLFISDELVADDLQHLYDEACGAGSDHALVTASITRAATRSTR